MYQYISKLLIISLNCVFGGSLSLSNRSKFIELLKTFTLDIDFPREANFQMIDYYVSMKEGRFLT